MKKAPNLAIETWRVKKGPLPSTLADGNNGVFAIPISHREYYQIILSDGEGWDHASVTIRAKDGTRTPTWREMCFIKDIVFEAEETVLQYHPAASQYVNVHPHVLHLWRPQNQDVPLPPRSMV